MRETIVTRLLDVVRHLIKIAGIFAVLCFSWTAVHWLWAVSLAIPVYLAVSGLVDFLSLPLYLLTPEAISLSEVLSAIQEQDFSTALRVLKTHERWHVAESQTSATTRTLEVCGTSDSLAHAVSAA